MSANRMFLVCQHCQNIEDTFCVGERAGNDVQFIAPSMKKLDAWYGKHANCGKGCDHFTFGFHRPHDWDQSPPAPAAAVGVRLALANETKQ